MIRSRGAWRLGLVLTLVGIPGALYPSASTAQEAPSSSDQALAAAFQPQRDTVLDRFLDDTQEILVELRIGRVARETVWALEMDGVALLPVGRLLEMGEVRFEEEENGSLRAVRHPDERMAFFSPARHEAWLNGTPVPLEPGWLARQEGVLYAAVPLLETLFDLTIRVDWSSLTVTVMDPEALPLGRRLAREARWRALGAPEHRDPADLYLGLDRRSVGGMVADWSLSTVANDPTGTAAFRLGLGARVLGGSLQVTSRSVGPAAQGNHRVDATYQVVRRGDPWLTQIRLGDGLSTGPRPRSVRGFALTNAPFLRGGFFGVDAFTGRVGPGWDVELRRAGRTLDVTRADEQGAFALDIPVRYGDNPVQVVAFGPHGEVVTADRLLSLARDRIPGGALEWGLSGGDCRSVACDLAGNVDLRYGLSKRWTIRGGLDGFVRDTLPDLAHPYLGVTGALTPSVQVAVEGVGRGFLRGGGSWTPSQHLRFRGAHTLFSTGVEAPVLHSSLRRATTEADVFVRPLTGSNRWIVQGSMVLQDMAGANRSRWQVSNLFRVNGVQLEAGLRREVWESDAGLRIAEDFQRLAATGMVPLAQGHRIWVRGEVETLDASHLSRARIRSAYQVTRDGRLEAGWGWSRLMGHDLTLSFTAHLPHLRSITQLFTPEAGDARLTQVAQGTVQWNEATGGVEFGNTPGLSRGGVSGYVFLDENGNGVLDPGEPVLENVRVVAGAQTVRTDERGRFQVWDLLPFEPLRVRVDPGSIPDPSWNPSQRVIEVEVPPASYRRVDIPLTPSGEISGRAVRVGPDGVERPVGYLELELADLDRGTRRSLTTFSDGEIYLHDVRPGRYELRLAPGALRGTGLKAETPAVPFTMPAEMARMQVDGLRFRLVPQG